MTPPPAPVYALAIVAAWNLHRSRRGEVTVSRWACEHKRVAFVALGVSNAWLWPHWWRYVIEPVLPD